jgi:ABC-2 type transport system permease protein
MTTYYILVFFVTLFADIHFHYEMSTMVYSGSLNQWLMRPISFFSTAASHILAKVIMLLIPGVIILLLGAWLAPPFPSGVPLTSFFTACAVLPLSIVMFGILSAAIGMLSFWIMKTDSVFALIMLILEFFGGRLLPLSMLPDWLKGLSTILPLRFAIALPVDAIILPGQVSIIYVLLGQVLWCMILFSLTIVLWKRGLKRFDAVGG